MNPPPHSPAFVLAFWLVILCISAFMLRQACSLYGEYMPGYGRAFLISLMVGAAAYFTYDLSAYAILLTMRDEILAVPKDYSYSNWLHEPLYLKWQVTGQIPGVRYIPVVFALCAAGVCQVFALELQVVFRKALVIFLTQWGATFVATALLGWGVSLLHPSAKEAPPAPPAPQQPPPAYQPDVPQRERFVVKNTEPEQRGWARFLERADQQADPYLEEFEKDAESVTQHLPGPAQRFLQKGGWWLVIAVLAVIALVWLRSTLKRLFRKPRKRRRKRRQAKRIEDLREYLGPLAEAFTDPGPKQITVKGLPGRLRLAVMAPAGINVGDLDPGMLDRVLDWIRQGLSRVTADDHPRVRVWPQQFSSEGFIRAFHSQVVIPEPRGKRSRWVLLAGTVSLGRQKINLGLAVLADQPNNIRQITIDKEQWLDVLGLERSRELV
jgi:hypothetical protein